MKSLNQQQSRLRDGRSGGRSGRMMFCVGCGRGRPLSHYKQNGNNYSHQCRKCRRKVEV